MHHLWVIARAAVHHQCARGMVREAVTKAQVDMPEALWNMS